VRKMFVPWLAAAAASALTFVACAPYPIVALDDVSDARRAQEQSALERHRTTWGEFDADGDGALNREEWRNRTWAYYMIYDIDGDARLSASEYMRSFCGDPQNRFPELIENCRRFVRQNLISLGFTGNRVEGLQRRSANRLLDAYFGVNDENRDGRVTREEMNWTK